MLQISTIWGILYMYESLQERVIKMIEFKHIKLEDKDTIKKYLFDGNERGCEYSFANLYMWGRQRYSEVEGHLVLFSQYDRKSVYPFPVGVGDKKAVLDALINDSCERGITCRFTGLTSREREILEKLYPNEFHIKCDRGSWDYVYDINDLAELRGRKFHSKKNKYNQFINACPDYRVEEINNGNIQKIKEMVDAWYRDKLIDNPDSEFEMEKAAIKKGFEHFFELDMDGIAIFCGDEVLAMTMGSFTSENTIDVHFEKARTEIDGTYAAINCEFARYLREKYPQLEYLNREEDMGIEGLRKAKTSYRPHHMIEKCWARKAEDGYEY